MDPKFSKPTASQPYGENIRCDGPPYSTRDDFRTLGYDDDAKVFVSLYCDGASGNVALEQAIANALATLFKLFKERQRKYGSGNIAAFSDYGVLVRCHDKLARLKRHYVEGVGDMPDESVEDAWMDLAVYATIALVCRKGQWPGGER